jgi:hypothetical protein
MINYTNYTKYCVTDSGVMWIISIDNLETDVMSAVRVPIRLDAESTGLYLSFRPELRAGRQVVCQALVVKSVQISVADGNRNRKGKIPHCVPLR